MAPRCLLSREGQLLVLTAGGPANDPEVRRLCNGELDWHRLFGLAQTENATLIVWQSLRRVGISTIPPDVETAWRQLAMVSEFQSLRLERLLHQALQALATRAIDVMLLKGSALAYTTYASFQDRPMGDVDLLVPPERAAEAWSLLQGADWKWSSDHFPADWYRTHHHLPPLYDATGANVGLELHRAPLPPGHPFRLEPQMLWLGAKRIQVNGQAVWVPNPLYRLLHLSVHFAWSHGMRGGVWRALRDVATISGRPQSKRRSNRRLAGVCRLGARDPRSDVLLLDAQAGSRSGWRAGSRRRAACAAPRGPDIRDEPPRAPLYLRSLPHRAPLPVRVVAPPPVGARYRATTERARRGSPLDESLGRSRGRALGDGHLAESIPGQGWARSRRDRLPGENHRDAQHAVTRD